MLKIYQFIIASIIFFTLSYALLYTEKEERIAEYLSERTKQYSENYKALYHQKQGLAQIIYGCKINTPEVIAMFKYASSSSEIEQDKAREKLYKHLKNTYELLKNQFMLKQLHFHTTDNISFLRFHRPDVYGDDLTDIRATIKYVNEHKRVLHGFEEGRIYNGYRFVFPMFDGDRHLGSVEVSFNTFTFNADFMEYHDVISNFYVLKSVVNEKVFENEKANYIDSPIENFVLEKEMAKEIEDLKNIHLNIPFSQKTIQAVNATLSESDSFSLYDELREEVITFIKVQNPVTQKVVGLFVVHSGAYYIFNKTSNFYFMLLIVNLFMLSLLFLIYKESEYRNKMHNINTRLENIVKEKTKEQSLLLSLFDKGDTVLFKWNNDKSWSVEDVSSSVLNLSGYTKNDFLSNKINYSDIIHKDDLKRVQEEVIRGLNSDEEFFKHSPYRIIDNRGNERWVLDYTIIVRDEKNRVVHFIGSISDITELKKKEEMLIKQSKLAQMGEMISMIAHQWRQPLGAISATLLDMKIKHELEYFNLENKNEIKKFNDFIDKNVDKMSTYVQNLSSTIDDFRNFYKPNKEADCIYLTEPVKKAFTIIQSSLDSDEITIIQNQLGKNKKIKLHNNEIMQVILNIIKNAQDNFKEKKSTNPTISITCDYLSNQEKVSLLICDNGGGIPENIIGKIFDPYFSTKDEKNGTGLGLYMSKTIVEEHHNGRLYAYNSNDGVCFVIEFLAASSEEVIER